MATYGNEKNSSQAPSGSRLAQYLNGRPTSSQQSPNQPNALSANGGYADDPYGNMPYGSGYAGYSIDPSQTSPNSVYNRNEELLAISQNIPFVELQLLNEDTLHRALNSTQSFFADADSRARLMAKQMAQQCLPLPNSDLPEVVEHFRNLCPVGSPSMRFGNHIEHVYKGVSTLDGATYSIHRLTNARQMNSYAKAQIENWSRMTHSNLIRLHSTLLTRAFNDSSQLFVYDFQALAEPLSKHFYHVNGSLKSKYVSNGIAGLNEQFVWQVIIQISSAIRTIHAANMAVRCLDLNRILVNSSGRFLISGSAIGDVFSDNTNLLALQIEDLRNFGSVLVGLLSGSIQAASPENVAHAAQQIDNHYSSDLKNVVKVLCHAYVQAPNRGTSINEIMPMIGARFYSQIENMQIRSDLLENDLCKELQNGRLFRLLGMLCSVCDRSLPREPYWSETSERYMLKLFRDYIFHQVDAFGRPILDLAHIVLNLNKLDSGLDEAVQLASRDNDNVLLVTYKELRSHLESSFEYLRKEMEAEVMDPAAIQPAGPI
ncbi:PAN2-PAN3 deadenylation complex subunit PAN3 [Aphelenchoides bicaudatus]|nr:PAN2-PAN3 deadenylation complex subunit PAN3 [Aphelenchoides bicaudatus]